MNEFFQKIITDLLALEKAGKLFAPFSNEKSEVNKMVGLIVPLESKDMQLQQQIAAEYYNKIEKEAYNNYHYYATFVESTHRTMTKTDEVLRQVLNQEYCFTNMYNAANAPQTLRHIVLSLCLEKSATQLQSVSTVIIPEFRSTLVDIEQK